MRYQFYYYIEAPQNVLTFLSENRIKHKVYDKNVMFSIYSSQPNYQELLATLTSTYRCEKPLIFCDYSAKDRDEAEYLWITPCRYCIEILNRKDAYQYSCEYEHIPTHTQRVRHRKQINVFQIGREPTRTMKAAFYSLDTGNDVLFADERIKKLAEQHHLQGLLFQPVLLRSGRESQHIFQLSSPHVLHMSAVARGYGERSEFCPLCGKEAIVPSSSYQMHLFRSHLDPSLDFMVSEAFWGEGISYSIQIISQRFYRLLKEEKLTGSLRIAPIILHD